MITYLPYSLFDSPAQTLVNTVNTVGVMGKGIAKEFKALHPEMFAQYQQLCQKGKIDIGLLWPYIAADRIILNFPTKKHWRNPSHIEYVEAGLQAFVANYPQYGITSVAFPPLGCGNGGLNWQRVVRPLMEQYLGELPIDVYIHTYSPNPHAPATNRHALRR